ncbi:MAG: hypothetical protein CME88_10760 [Hirschia sp.]|nr:hypothetical protein [Hirschia sp.]MBF18848.1 hypothetical protein [Hirschia sp.]|tara:strand:+ start:463 stop:999 length:537 start_codon:yes stop_codon:yes gene_type:complete
MMLMRALGQGSLSSVLKILVDAAWVAACAALGFIWLIAAISLVAQLAGGELKAGVLGEISIHGAGNLVSWTVVGSIVCLGVMAISSLLRGVFETLVAGDPFVPENAVRLRKISMALAGLELARLFVGPVINLLMHDGGELTLRFATNFVVWGAVLVLIVLSQVFDEGARLREDQKMTI